LGIEIINNYLKNNKLQLTINNYILMLNNPFKDLLVVELASVLAGPAVGMWFAEMGARVVKLENIKSEGDVTRSWKLNTEDPDNAISSYFCSVNAGKEHLMIDLKEEEGIQVVHEWLQKADILITNFKVGDDIRYGLDYGTLKVKYPGLICGSIGGFRTNPERTAYDVVIQAETGYMSMNGTEASGPLKMPVALMDVMAAHQLISGILVALWHREKTGEGSLVETNLEDAGLAGLVNQASAYLMSGKVAQRMGSLHPNIAPYGDTFECGDGVFLVLAVGSDAQFRVLCRELGKEELADDSLLLSNQNRVQNRDYLQESLATLFRKTEGKKLYDRLINLKVPVGKIKNLDEVLNDPEHEERINRTIESGEETARMRFSAFKISK
jgi:crotonobetainyl-CoA:carnitine CoA-transferase CaiB-like acyl-CoA transferase